MPDINDLVIERELCQGLSDVTICSLYSRKAWQQKRQCILLSPMLFDATRLVCSVNALSCRTSFLKPDTSQHRLVCLSENQGQKCVSDSLLGWIKFSFHNASCHLRNQDFVPGAVGHCSSPTDGISQHASFIDALNNSVLSVRMVWLCTCSM